MIDIVERLHQIAYPKAGGGMLIETNGTESIAQVHYAAISAVCADAITEIGDLRAKLDLMRRIAGKASVEGMTFSDIKKEIRRG